MFDVFFEIEVEDTGLRLSNTEPLVVEADITEIPPRNVSLLNQGPVELTDPQQPGQTATLQTSGHFMCPPPFPPNGPCPVPCSQSPFPVCDAGDCPPGLHCEPNPATGACECVPDDVPCEQSDEVARVSRVVGGHQMMFLGAFGGQTLLHFLLWVFNPRLRSNAYFTLTTACVAGLVGLHFERVLSDDPQFVWLCYRLWNVLLILTMMALVRFVYEVFDRKPRWVFFGLSAEALSTFGFVLNDSNGS